MDRTVEYRRIVREVLSEIAGYSNGHVPKGVDHVVSFDDENGQYLLMSIGWRGDKRVHSIPVYVRLKDGQVWIEDDWTDLVIADRLVAAGVSPEDLRLGFQPPQTPESSKLAVA